MEESANFYLTNGSFPTPVKNIQQRKQIFPFKKLVTSKKIISPSEGCHKGISHFKLLDHLLHNAPRLEEKNASAKMNCI